MLLPALIAASFAYALTTTILNPVMLQVARSFHVGVGLAGQGRTLLSAAGALTALGATFVADRVPRRRQLLVGLGALVLGYVAIGFARTFGAWMALQVVLGAGAAIVSMAGTAATADYFEEGRRGAAMGWITSGYPLAWLIGLPLVGWLADGWGWRASYLAGGAGVSALALLGVLALLPAPSVETAMGRAPAGGWRAVRRVPAARGWILGELLANAAWSSFLVFAGPFFGVAYGFGAGQIGLVMAAFAAAAILGTASSGWWGRRWGRRPVLLASTFLAAFAVALPFSLSLPALTAAALVLPYGFLGSVRFPTSGTIALSLLPDAHATMMAARSLTLTVSAVAGTILSGVLLTVAGFHVLGPAYAALTLAGLAVYWRALP